MCSWRYVSNWTTFSYFNVKSVDRCLERPEVGPCEALVPSFFFNSSSGMCERFTYGGCRGNENRFSSGSACLQACSPDSKLFLYTRKSFYALSFSASINRCWVSCMLFALKVVLYMMCVVRVWIVLNYNVLKEVRWSQMMNIAALTAVVSIEASWALAHSHSEPLLSEHCREGETPCINGTCIVSEYFCDSLTDCPGGYDEFNCHGGWAGQLLARVMRIICFCRIMWIQVWRWWMHC